MVFVNPYIVKDGKCFARKRKYLPDDVLVKMARWMVERNAKSEDIYDCPLAKEYNLTSDNFAFDVSRGKDGKIYVGKERSSDMEWYLRMCIGPQISFYYDYYED